MTRRPLAMILASALGAAAMMIAPVAASAQRGGHWHRGDGGGGGDWDRGGPPGGGYRGDGARGYYGRGGAGPRGYYGRHHRCRDSGGGGTIIGAIAGGLLGNSIAGYGDRTAGTILGAGGGALVGRAIDRDC